MGERDGATRMVRAAGHRVRMRACGSGPPLLLLGGLGTNIEMLEPVFAELDGFRVISYDVPGAGSSATPLFPLTMRAHAAVAEAVLHTDGHASATVLGLSFGGLLAQQLAHSFPDAVDALVLVSTAVGWGAVPGSPFAFWQLANAGRYTSQLWFEATAPLFLGGRGAYTPELLRRQGKARVANPPSALGYTYQLCTASTFSSLGWLSTVDVPALVVAGAQDPLVPPANGRMLHDLLPDSELYVVPDGGHTCLLDDPAPIVARLREFHAAHGLGERHPAETENDEGAVA